MDEGHAGLVPLGGSGLGSSFLLGSAQMIFRQLSLEVCLLVPIFSFGQSSKQWKGLYTFEGRFALDLIPNA
jgi:hypothetical protein